MNPLYVGLFLAGIGGIGGAGLIGSGGAGYPTDDQTLPKNIGRICRTCPLFFGLLSIIEWWLLDVYNDKPATMVAPLVMGVVTGMAGTTLLRMFPGR